MSVYIYKNKQQSGPFDENAVLGWLRNGQLTAEDFACRTGAGQWQKLKDLFPPASTSISADTGSVNKKTVEPPVYRKTTLQKIVFGGILVLLIFAFVGAVFYLKSFWVLSGDLDTDLMRAPFKTVAEYGVIAILIALIFALTAFLLSFKKKIIQSFGLRMGLRLFFVLFIVLAALQISYGGFKYQNYSPPYRPLIEKNKQNNPLLQAFEKAENEADRNSYLAIHLPVAFGFLVFGAAGFSMTQFKCSGEE